MLEAAAYQLMINRLFFSLFHQNVGDKLMKERNKKKQSIKRLWGGGGVLETHPSNSGLKALISGVKITA